MLCESCPGPLGPPPVFKPSSWRQIQTTRRVPGVCALVIKPPLQRCKFWSPSQPFLPSLPYSRPTLTGCTWPSLRPLCPPPPICSHIPPPAHARTSPRASHRATRHLSGLLGSLPHHQPHCPQSFTPRWPPGAAADEQQEDGYAACGPSRHDSYYRAPGDGEAPAPTQRRREVQGE